MIAVLWLSILCVLPEPQQEPQEHLTRTITYTYDPLHRLTGAEYSTGERFEYQYDALSNVMVMTETITATIVTHYTYNAANRLLTARRSDDGITWHYTFDHRGNLTRQTPGGTAPAEGETRYTYDATGHLVRVELYTAGAYIPLAEAAYNGDGERVRLTTWAEGVPFTVTSGVFQGQLLVSAGSPTVTFFLQGRGLIGEHRGGWTYPLRDGEGSVRQEVDEEGNVVLARSYRPFGGILQEQGQYETAFGFLGAQLDRISGLLYAGGRYYDPATGRYLTPQRGFDPYRPRTLNPYVPLQDPALWLLAPVGVVAALVGRKKWRKSGYWLLVLLGVGIEAGMLLSGCGPVTPTLTPVPPSQPPTQPPTPTPTPPPTPTPTPSGKTAYLTFDDGPDPYITPQIARELQAREVAATFFLTGADPSISGDPYCSDGWLRIYSPDLSDPANELVVLVIQSTGHAIGVHGWRHDHPWNVFDPADEVRRTEEALRNILGQGFSARLLRAPGGAFPAEVIKGYADSYYYGWDIPSKVHREIDGYGIDGSTVVTTVCQTSAFW